MKLNKGKERKKAACPGLKDRDAYIGGVENDELLSNEARHARRDSNSYRQMDLGKDLEILLEQTGRKVDETIREASQMLSNSYEQAKETIGTFCRRWLGK